MRLFLFLFLALALTGCDLLSGSEAPSPSTPLRTTFGTEHYDAGSALIELRTGELLIAGIGGGVVAPADGTLPTPSLTKLRRDGRRVWSRVYERLRYAAAEAVVEHRDGYLLLVSRSDDGPDYGGGVQGRTIALWKVSAEGALVRPIYERAGSYVPYGASRPLLATRDGGFVILGEEWDGDAGPPEAFAVKLTPSGDVLWERRLEGFAELNAALEAPDGDLLLAGTRLQVDYSNHDEDLFLARTSADGAVRWAKTYGTPGETERGFALAAAPDGGYVLAGMQTSEVPYDRLAYALRVDEAGGEVWSATYGAADAAEEAYGITATPDGGFVLAGVSRPPRSGSAVYLLKIDGDGRRRWSQEVGSKGRNEFARAVLALRDGALAVTGATGPDRPSYGGDDFDVLFLITSADGDVP